MVLQDVLGSSEINSKMANKIPKAFDVVTLVDVIEDYFGDDCKAMHIWNQVRGSWFEQRVPF